MALFSICVSGWEEYYPIWFSKDCSVDEFRETVKKYVVDSCKSLCKGDNFIEGHKLIEKLIPMMKKNGFVVIKPELEIDLKGECIYDNFESEPECRDKPNIMDDETWKMVVKHNDKVREELHRSTEDNINDQKAV